MKYEPIYNENSDELINDIREYIGKTNNDMTNIDTLDICHLLGKIDNLNSIINELEKTFVNDDKRIKEYNIEHPERPLDNYSKYYLDKLKELKEGK